jgi:membrane protein DedA with SNARE-associated domain
MIRVFLVFAILAALIHFGITGWRSMTGKERWSLTKTVSYSIIVSLLAIVVLMFIVVLF